MAGRGERVSVIMVKEFDGITIGGKSVESFLVGKRVKDTLDVMKDEKHYPKRKGRTKYMDHTETNGKATSLRENVIKALLAGQVLTVKKLCEDYDFSIPQTAGSVLRSILNSEFGDLYMKKGDYKDPDSGRLALNYYIPEYVGNTGVKFSDVQLSIKTAVKLSRNHTASKKKVVSKLKDDAVPGPRPEVGERLPTLEPIIRDVVLNLILKIKVEIV
jgi:hypothetical protein